LQVTIEDIKLDIGSKRKSAALDGVRKARTQLKQKAAKMLPSCRDDKICTEILGLISKKLDPLEASLRDSIEYMNGSEQERAALDKAYEAQSSISQQITALEEQMVPKGYKAQVPPEYDDLPQLEGRATVEFLFKKSEGAPFNVNGQNYPQAKLIMIIDGYTGTWFILYYTWWEGTSLAVITP
jgi:hypothetical protein